MKKILVMLFGVMLLCAIPLMASANPYQVIGTGAITWADARAAAQALPGGWDLASITSASEQTAVDAAIAAYNPAPADRTEFWIGGMWDVNTTWTPGQWVSGETWGYTNWWDGEPNSVDGNEAHLAVDWRLPTSGGPAGGAWMWNDEGSAPQYIVGYVAESVPEPTTMLLLGLGLLGVAGIRRKFKV